jgi:hypothetical protein
MTLLHSPTESGDGPVYEIVYGLEVKGASVQLQRVLPWLRPNDEIEAVGVRLGRPFVTGNTNDFERSGKPA